MQQVGGRSFHAVAGAMLLLGFALFSTVLDLSGPPFLLSPPVVLFQGITFLVFFHLMQRHVFGKVLTFLHHREQEIGRRTREAEDRGREVDARRAAYEAGLAAADKKAYEVMQGVVREGMAKKTETVAGSYDEASRLLAEARASLTREKEQALLELRRSVDDMAELVYATVTKPGQKVSGRSLIGILGWAQVGPAGARAAHVPAEAAPAPPAPRAAVAPAAPPAPASAGPATPVASVPHAAVAPAAAPAPAARIVPATPVAPPPPEAVPPPPRAVTAKEEPPGEAGHEDDKGGKKKRRKKKH